MDNLELKNKIEEFLGEESKEKKVKIEPNKGLIERVDKVFILEDGRQLLK